MITFVISYVGRGGRLGSIQMRRSAPIATSDDLRKLRQAIADDLSRRGVPTTESEVGILSIIALPVGGRS